MASGVRQIRKQRGVVLLALFAILFIAGAGVLISVLDSNAVTQRRNNNTASGMRDAKEALIAYATLYGEYYSATNAGPGYLPCPDSNNDGLEDNPCVSLGRLPQSIVLPLPNGSIFSLSNYNADIDEQFWYGVADVFRRDSLAGLNSSTISGMTLDGQGSIVAVLIAPGPSNGTQSRPSNVSSRYLEDGNTAAPSFVSSAIVNPELFNDRVLTITIDEIMGPVTRQIADILKVELDVYHAANLQYPADQTAFDNLFIAPAIPVPVPAWVTANGWLAISNYTYVSDDRATLTFTGCANIIYTVDYSPADLPGDLTRRGLRC